MVEEFEGKTLASKLDIPFMEISAKTGEGCIASFEALCRSIVLAQLGTHDTGERALYASPVKLNKNNFDTAGKRKNGCC